MKKILTLAVLMVLAFTTMSSNVTNGDFLLNVKKGNGNEISFSLNGLQKVTVFIYDDENNLIYTEKAAGEKGILKTYNLDEFPIGTYYLVVENNLKKVKHEIVISEQKTILTTKAISEIYKPTLKKQNVANVN